MQKSDLTELEIEIQDLKLRLARPGGASVTTTKTPGAEVSHQHVTSQIQSIAASSPPPPDDGLHHFASPMVGTFYRKPGPKDASFVEVGDVVKKGDALCIVEAMKVMNEIQSDVAGEIVEALVEDAHSVEYGQTLFKIRKS